MFEKHFLIFFALLISFQGLLETCEEHMWIFDTECRIVKEEKFRAICRVEYFELVEPLSFVFVFLFKNNKPEGARKCFEEEKKGKNNSICTQMKMLQVIRALIETNTESSKFQCFLITKEINIIKRKNFMFAQSCSMFKNTELMVKVGM